MRTIMPHWYNLQQEAYALEGEPKIQKLQAALAAAQAFKPGDHYPDSEVLFSLAVFSTELNKRAEA
ncbi:hypothetical protein BH11CYA1_BH11CYA1_28520 [soil metagenome]